MIKILFLGLESSELTLKTQLFKNHTNVLYWRVELKISKGQGTSGFGIASITFLKNQLPANGYCLLDKYNGTSLSTQFNIKCLGWIDPDGYVERYEFLGIFSLKPS